MTIAKLISALAFIVISLLIIWGLVLGMDKADRARCLELKSQSENIEREIFFITPLEKKMCDYWQINIDAQVGDPYGYTR